MIEVAAATAMVATWARRVDYFALGTNDLVASALGIHRDDSSAGSADPLHPGVLRIIQNVVESAHAAERRVTACGEMAGDPQGCLALAALNVDSVSVAVQQLGAVRSMLAQPSTEHLAGLAAELMSLETADQVRSLLRKPEV
jgi:phosphoenolpyruvate-protein kinase (PTS system EI component)